MLCMCVSRCHTALPTGWMSYLVCQRSRGVSSPLAGCVSHRAIKIKKIGVKKENMPAFSFSWCVFLSGQASVSLVSQTRLMTFSWDGEGCRFARFVIFNSTPLMGASTLFLANDESWNIYLLPTQNPHTQFRCCHFWAVTHGGGGNLRSLARKTMTWSLKASKRPLIRSDISQSSSGDVFSAKGNTFLTLFCCYPL